MNSMNAKSKESFKYYALVTVEIVTEIALSYIHVRNMYINCITLARKFMLGGRNKVNLFDWSFLVLTKITLHFTNCN